MLEEIGRLQLNRIKQRVEARYKIPLEDTDDVAKLTKSVGSKANREAT